MMLWDKCRLLPREWLVIIAGGLLSLSVLSAYQLLRGFQVDSHGVRLNIPNKYYYEAKRKPYTFTKSHPAKKHRFAVEIPSDDWLKAFEVEGLEKDPWGKIKFYILTNPPSVEPTLSNERLSLVGNIVEKKGVYQQANFVPDSGDTYRVYRADSKDFWDMFIRSPDALGRETIRGDERIGYCATVATKGKTSDECYLQFYQGATVISLKVPLSHAIKHQELKRMLFAMLEDWRN